MKTSLNTSLAGASLVVLGVLGCSGSLDAPSPSSDAVGSPGSGAGAGGVADPSGSTAGQPGAVPPGGVPVGTNPPVTDVPLDVNRVGIHRLNKAEYDNTMRDLLGVTTTPASTFIADETLLGFDNIASAFGMTEAQYEQYFNAADALVDGVFADPALAARIMICAPAGAADAACIGQILSTFGARAWRRPLTAAEVTRLTLVVTDAMTLGEDATGAIKQVVKTMLSSVPFLYRVEMDADPASLVVHPIDAYELASRLSYLGWSSMPDDALFAQAASGALLTDATLSAEVDRLLADSRADQFVTNFAGQWLGLRGLMSHQVDATVFPTWSEPLRMAMVQEGMLYFKEFLTGTRQMTEFFTADVNFVDTALGAHYGIAGGAGTTLTPVSNTMDARVGFMGLASFLTFTSFSYRTAPTLRGKWVLENLLCQDIPDPPPGVPDLDDPGIPSADLQSENVRVRLEAHRNMEAACSACHQMLDPIGFGLENYDAIGRYRTQYDNGDVIDSSGQLPTGETFSGLQELTAILSADSKLTDCASERLMTYALSREVVDADLPYLQQIRQNWATGGFGLRGLLKQIVLNDTFRFRRGETGVAQ